LEPRAAMTAGLEAPLVDLPLMPADARADPGGPRQDLFDLGAQKIEHRPARGHCVRHTHDELHMRPLLDEAFLHQIGRVVQHGQVEDLDLGLDSVFEHGLCESFDEVWRVLVNAYWKVD